MKAPKTKKECQEEVEDFKNDNNYENIQNEYITHSFIHN